MGTFDQIFVSALDTLLGFLPESIKPYAAMGIIIGTIAAIAPLIMMYLTWLERKILGRMQNRLGPNRVGIYGLLQPLADGVKMFIKEDVVPRNADKLLHLLAPIVAVAPAILLFAVIPFGRNMVAADINVGLLYFLAVGSISSYAIFMGGWASRSKFPIIGAMRAVAQIISYEVPGVLSVVTVIMVTGTLSLSGVVEAQSARWFLFTPWGFIGFWILFLSGIAEVNRTPFDMPEAESELVGGFHTEYSGMKFALWYMAEFLEAFAICAFAVTLFLGGWNGLTILTPSGWQQLAIPFWPLALILALIVGTASRLPITFRTIAVIAFAGLGVRFGLEVIPSWIWFFLKTYSLIFLLIWIRGTLPRLRIDQLMGFAWKFLLPLSLVNILAAGLWVILPFPVGTLISIGLLSIAYFALIFINNPAPLQKRTYQFAE